MTEVLHLINWKIKLTWRLYTRHTLASLETLLFFLVFFVWLVFGWWVLGHATHWALENGFILRALVFSDLFSFIFVAWLLLCLVGYRLNESYDLGKLRAYPLPLWKVFAASLLGPFADLTVLLPLTGFLAVFLAGGPLPDQIPVGVLLVLALFFLLVVSGQALVTVLYVMLPRLNLVAVGMAIIIGVLVWAVLLNLGVVGYPMPDFYVLLRPYGIDHFRPYPAGQIAVALDAYMDGRWLDMPQVLLGFGTWTAGIVGLNYLLLRYWWASDRVSGMGAGRTSEHDAVPRIAGWLERVVARLVGAEAAALFRKDLLNLFARSPYFLLYKVLPGAIAPAIILLSMRWNLENVSRLSSTPEFARGIVIATFTLVGFIVIAQANLFSGNQFGLEDTAIRGLMVLPTSRRSILIGKNAFLGSLFLGDALVLSALSLLFFPTPFVFFAVLSLLVTLFLLILSIGNYASAIWPYWMPLDKPSFTLRSTVVLGLVNVGAVIALVIAFAPALAAVVVPHLLGNDVVTYVCMPLVVIYGLVFHRLTLRGAVGLLESNEFLILRRVTEREEL